MVPRLARVRQDYDERLTAGERQGREVLGENARAFPSLHSWGDPLAPYGALARAVERLDAGGLPARPPEPPTGEHARVRVGRQAIAETTTSIHSVATTNHQQQVEAQGLPPGSERVLIVQAMTFRSIVYVVISLFSFLYCWAIFCLYPICIYLVCATWYVLDLLVIALVLTCCCCYWLGNATPSYLSHVRQSTDGHRDALLHCPVARHPRLFQPAHLAHRRGGGRGPDDHALG